MSFSAQKLVFLHILLFFAGAVWSCSGGPSQTQSSDPLTDASAGKLDGPCFEDGTCNPGLTCESGFCKPTPCQEDSNCPSNQFCLNEVCSESNGMNWIKSVWEKSPEEATLPDCPSIKSIYVSTSGNDQTGNGSDDKPYKTIQKAVDTATECSKITVSKGTYNEIVKVNRKNKLIIQGVTRESIIDAGESVTNWTSVPTNECNNQQNCGVYKAALPDASKTVVLYINDKKIIPIKLIQLVSAAEYSASFSEAGNVPYTDSADARKKRLQKGIRMLTNGPVMFEEITEEHLGERPYDNWNNIYASYFIDAAIENKDYINGGSIYLKIFDKGKFNQSNDPNGLQIKKGLGTGIHIADSSNIVVRGLTVKNGTYGIVVYRDSHNCTIEDNHIQGGKRAVYIQSLENDGPENIDLVKKPSDIKVYANYVTLNYAASTSPDDENANDLIFSLVKFGGNDEHTVCIYGAGDNIRIHHNYLFGSMNGVQDIYHPSFEDKADRFNRYLEVDHNIFENMQDDCMEPSSAGIEAKWHDNLLLNCSQGLRTKMFSRLMEDVNGNAIKDANGEPIVRFDISKGPFYIYRNVFINHDNYSIDDFPKNLPPNNLFNIYFYSGHNAKLYIFNNTFIGFRGLAFGSTTSSLLAPNTYFLNNLFSNLYSVGQYYESIGKNNRRIVFDYNILGGIFKASYLKENGQWTYWALPSNLFGRFYRWGKKNIDLRSENEDTRIWRNPISAPLDIGNLCIPADYTDSIEKGVDLSKPFSIDYDTVILAYDPAGESVRTDSGGTINLDPMPVVTSGESGYIGAFKPDDTTSCMGLNWLRK